MHKARAAVSSPPSAPLNGITELFDKSLPTSMERVYGEGNLCAGGSCKSSHHSLRTEFMYSRLTQLRKKRKKRNKTSL
jgi:hypothetical protein